MTLAFDLPVEDDYDITCQGIEAWPAPDRDSYIDLYIEIECDDSGLCEPTTVPYHTSYSFFQEGDLKRAIMDAAAPDTPMADRRSEYVFDGKYCIYWDNYEGVNPQPWAEGDCGLQALWLNDDYYECAEAGLIGEEGEDCDFDDFAFFS